MTQPATLQSVLEKSFSRQTDNMYTSIPGIVVNVRNNLSTLSVDVKPAVNIVREDGTEEERPSILNVPVSMPVNFEGGLTHPVKVGDNVLLIFSMRGIDLWKRGNGNPVRPSDARKFSIKDCIAIPLQTFGNSVNNPLTREWPHSTDDVVVFHNAGTGRECEVRFKTTGDIEINTNQNVIINAANVTVNTQVANVYSPQSNFYGDVNITGTANIDVDALIGGISFIGHVHGITSGSSAPGPTEPPQ